MGQKLLLEPGLPPKGSQWRGRSPAPPAREGRDPRVVENHFLQMSTPWSAQMSPTGPPASRRRHPTASTTNLLKGPESLHSGCGRGIQTLKEQTSLMQQVRGEPGQQLALLPLASPDPPARFSLPGHIPEPPPALQRRLHALNCARRKRPLPSRPLVPGSSQGPQHSAHLRGLSPSSWKARWFLPLGQVTSSRRGVGRATAVGGNGTGHL